MGRASLLCPISTKSRGLVGWAKACPWHAVPTRLRSFSESACRVTHAAAPVRRQCRTRTVTRPVGESDGEEEDGAFDVCTTVPRHGEMSVSIYRFAWLHVRAFALHGLGRETLGYACSWHKAAEANTRAMSEVDISPLDGNSHFGTSYQFAATQQVVGY
jgi:hypothetical protein